MLLSTPTDYENALSILKDFPKYYLGQEVQTPIGKGILIELHMKANGLYLHPPSSTCIVWFSTQSSKEGWVQKLFDITDIDEIK